MRLFGGSPSSQSGSNVDDMGVGLKPLPTPVAAAPPPPALATSADALAFERERWEEEKSRYERQRLDTEFNDALNRLADIQNPFMRAGGANRVAALARRHMVATQDIEDAYPYFVRASGHLAAALHLEDESAVRDEVHKALDMMTDFARFEGDMGQLLIYSLLDDIAAANRSARKAFVAALARHLARTAVSETTYATNYDALRPLVDFTSFCPREEDTFRCLCDIADSPDCRTQTRFQAAVGLAQALRKSASLATQSTDALDVVYRTGERLKETTAALTACLRALTAVPEEIVDGGEVRLGMWRRAGRRLHLAGTFLAGARLAGAHLIGANMMDAVLHGSELDGTSLLGANLFGAKLGGTNLFNVILAPEGNPSVPTGAPAASLTGADWWQASPTSWRGGKGEALKKWLLSRYPAPAETGSVPNWNDAPAGAPVNVPTAAESPVSAARAGRSTGGRSVRALFGGVAANSAPVTKDAEIADEEDESSDSIPLDVHTVRTDTVQVRASGRPGYGDTFNPRDMSAVHDLMSERTTEDLTRVTEESVQVRTSANPNDLRHNPRVSSRDLLAVQDLMKER
ncbi:MAG: pentapeptide repeat-containing protein [Akkermansiaceae bacterium]|nr:pentapeptide repeat-containing protein [Armatimonadota bacterium]